MIYRMSSNSTDKATILALRRRQQRRTPPSSAAVDKSSSQAKTTANLLEHVRQAVSTDITDTSKSVVVEKDQSHEKKVPYDGVSRKSATQEARRQDRSTANDSAGLNTTYTTATKGPPHQEGKQHDDPHPKIIQPRPSSQKRPLVQPIVDTQPPLLLPHRYQPLWASSVRHKCLNGEANELISVRNAWKVVPVERTDSIHFGSTRVQWQNRAGEYLNITAQPNDDMDDGPLAISLSTTWDVKDPSTIWTLHPVTDVIPVGSDAAVQSMGPPVRTSLPFVMRNIEWNGILQSSTLSLLTDAHGQPDIATDESLDENGEHPMSRLWHAHSLVPSILEAWYAGECSDSIYHDDGDEDLKQRLFGTAPKMPKPTKIPSDTAKQETILLDELLGACMGVSGNYIVFDHDSFQLQGSTYWDTVLHTCIVDWLEVPTTFRIVDAWLEWQRHSECPVRRALYQQVQNIMDEYLEIILLQYQALRNGSLSIHSLQALHRARHMMNDMLQVCQRASNGGALIQQLLRQSQRWTDAVMVPYQEQLHAWITQGILMEPHYFMIQRNPAAKCWADTYMVRRDHVLTDLLPTTRLVQQTLETGRYWNAVGKCQTIPTVETIKASLTAFVESQHEQASKALKALLLPDLKPTLQLIQDYFLMYNADMYLSFLEKASPELDKDIELISRHRIQHFFNDSRIQCFFRFEGSNHAVKNVQGIDAFAIRLTNLSFPSVILLTKQVMANYTSIFRHLFKVTYTKQKLLAVWKDHQLTKDLSFTSCLRSTFALRHRMLHFIDNLHYFLRSEVVEAQWAKFLRAMSNEANSVDDILQIQQLFFDTVLDTCMLNDRKAKSTLTKLINTCVSFTAQIDNFHDATQLTMHDPSRRRVTAFDDASPSAKLCRERLEKAQERRERRRDIQTSRIQQEASSESYQNMVTRFSEVYDRRLNDFVSTLSSQHVSLQTRLNFNRFSAKSDDGV